MPVGRCRVLPGAYLLLAPLTRYMVTESIIGGTHLLGTYYFPVMVRLKPFRPRFRLGWQFTTPRALLAQTSRRVKVDVRGEDSPTHWYFDLMIIQAGQKHPGRKLRPGCKLQTHAAPKNGNREPVRLLEFLQFILHCPALAHHFGRSARRNS